MNILTNRIFGLMAASLVASMATACVDDESLGTDGLESQASELTTDVTSTYFVARQDPRRCLVAAPNCGGIYVHRVNQATTTCIDGVNRAECYLPGADFAALSPSASEAAYLNGRLLGGELVVRATIASKSYTGYGNLGVLKVTEGWDAATSALPAGTFTFEGVTNSGIVCVKAPCPSVHIADLNTTSARNISEVNLNLVGASDAQVAQAHDAIATAKILVAGGVAIQGGTTTLIAQQFYLAFHHVVDVSGGWHYQRTATSDRYDYVFATDGTFTSHETPGCAFSRPQCYLVMPVNHGTYQVAADNKSVHLDYTSTFMSSVAADFTITVNSAAAATRLTGKDFGVALTLTH